MAHRVALGDPHRLRIRHHRRQPAAALGVLELLALGGELALGGRERLRMVRDAEPASSTASLGRRRRPGVAARAVAQQLVQSRLQTFEHGRGSLGIA